MLGRIAPLLPLLLLATPAQAGLDVCNTTRTSVSVALGQFDGSGWLSEGWWDIPAGHCTAVISEPLKARYYYLYATDGGSGSWDGDRGFCVRMGAAFRIKGRGDCAAAGYDRKGFFEIDTGNMTEYRQTLSN